MPINSFPEMETERLLLREIGLEDAEDLFAYYNDRLVTQYLDWYGPSSVEHAQELITRWCDQFAEGCYLRWGISLKGDKRIIGTVSIAPVRGPFEWKLPVCLGYELSRSYWNQRIMSEAVEAVMGYVFAQMGHHRMIAEVYPENGASLTLLTRLGFKQEGVLKKHLWHEGTSTWHDVITLAALRKDEEIILP